MRQRQISGRRSDGRIMFSSKKKKKKSGRGSQIEKFIPKQSLQN
jgi:hypothetical protein